MPQQPFPYKLSLLGSQAMALYCFFLSVLSLLLSSLSSLSFFPASSYSPLFLSWALASVSGHSLRSARLYNTRQPALCPSTKHHPTMFSLRFNSSRVAGLRESGRARNEGRWRQKNSFGRVTGTPTVNLTKALFKSGMIFTQLKKVGCWAVPSAFLDPLSSHPRSCPPPLFPTEQRNSAHSQLKEGNG